MIHTLGRVRFTDRSGAPRAGAGGLTMDVHLTEPGAAATEDRWTTARPVTVVPGPRVQYAHDGEVALFAARIPQAPRYADLVEDLYAEPFARTTAAGYPNVFRIWQYIQDINAPNADGLENYRDYCAGRAAAFENHRGTTFMPSATGVGARSGGVSVHLLAGRSEVRHIENPRQLPAYRYPGRYGPRPPSFARATWRDGALHLAGTASIVGHRTTHAGDADAQCATTLTIIEALLDRGNLARNGIDATLGLADLDHVKVYVRHERDVAAVRRRCRAAFAADATVSVLVADLCRADLLVEIEGTATPRPAHRGG